MAQKRRILDVLSHFSKRKSEEIEKIGKMLYKRHLTDYTLFEKSNFCPKIQF